MKTRREFTLPAFQYDVLENDKDPLDACGDDVAERQDLQSVGTRSLPSLRVIAVAAPDRIEGRKEERALNSRDPASLFNACRIAASRAFSGRGPWGESNWAKGGRIGIRRNFLLMYSLDDMPEFVRLIKREKPNVILLGAMSLCMPEQLNARGSRGRYWADKSSLFWVVVIPMKRFTSGTKKARQTTDVLHHAGSPARLMRENRIPPSIRRGYFRRSRVSDCRTRRGFGIRYDMGHGESISAHLSPYSG